MTGSTLLGMGHYVPPRTVTNDDLASLMDTTDEWIVQRTGIRQRHLAGPDETTSVLGTRAELKNMNSFKALHDGLAHVEPRHGHAALDAANQFDEFEVEVHRTGELRGAGLERAQLGDLPGFTSALERLYLAAGDESEAWDQAVATIEDLVWSVQPKRTREDRKHLVALLPSLDQYSCSYGEPGGFMRRMREDEGTWLGHVLEHVAI